MLTKEKEILFNVIETYRDMPYLWDKRHRNYKNQELRKEGNKILFEIYKEFDSRATVRNLVKKVQNLRTTFFKELRKVKSSIRSGVEPVYIPTLWYFEAMSFLAAGRANQDINDTEYTHDHEDRSHQSDLQTTEYDDNSSTSSHRNDPIHVFPMTKKRRLKKVLKTEIDDTFTMNVSPRESKVPTGMKKEEDNECELYAQLLAQKLKRIDEDQRLVLMNEIDNLVFKSVMLCKAREPSSVFFTMVDSNADAEEV